MHPTTGWLLCQKMKSTLSLHLCCHCLCGRSYHRHCHQKRPLFSARNESDHRLVVMSITEVVAVHRRWGLCCCPCQNQPLSPAIFVSIFIIIEISPPPCQECIQPQVGCCVKKLGCCCPCCWCLRSFPCSPLSSSSSESTPLPCHRQ